MPHILKYSYLNSLYYQNMASSYWLCLVFFIIEMQGDIWHLIVVINLLLLLGLRGHSGNIWHLHWDPDSDFWTQYGFSQLPAPRGFRYCNHFWGNSDGWTWKSSACHLLLLWAYLRPQQLKNNFDFTQRVLLLLGHISLKPKIQSLKNLLMECMNDFMMWMWHIVSHWDLCPSTGNRTVY